MAVRSGPSGIGAGIAGAVARWTFARTGAVACGGAVVNCARSPATDAATWAVGMPIIDLGGVKQRTVADSGCRSGEVVGPRRSGSAPLGGLTAVCAHRGNCQFVAFGDVRQGHQESIVVQHHEVAPNTKHNYSYDVEV